MCCGASAFYTSPRGVSTAHALSQRTPNLVAQRLSQPLSPRALVPLPLDPHSPITYFPHATSCLRQWHHHSLSLSENVYFASVSVFDAATYQPFLACFFLLQFEPCVFNSHYFFLEEQEQCGGRGFSNYVTVHCTPQRFGS